MIEVNHTEGAGDEWPEVLTSYIELSIATDKREDISMSELDQRKLNVVRVGAKVLQGMQALSK